MGNVRIRTLIIIFFLATVIVTCNCNDSKNDREEVIFYEDSNFEGDRLFISLAKGCYSFDRDWNNRISSVDTQGHCIIAWEHGECHGSSVRLAPGVRGLGNLKQLQFDNMISAITVCRERSAAAHHSGRGNMMEPESTRSSDEIEIWKLALQEHNKYRRMHGVRDLHGDPNLHQAAQRHAEYLAKSHKFETTTENDYGQNLATSYKDRKFDAIQDVVARWYDKIEYYDFRDPESNKSRPKSGQFSSIVWKSTTHMGLGIAWNERERKWIVVAFYDPSATQSNYGKNVPPPLKWK